MKTITKLWVLIAILAALSPVGLIFPEYAKSGAAWGEWSPDEIKEFIGYIPRGILKLSSLWNAPIPDYAFRGWEKCGLSAMSVSYMFSAAVGILVVAGIVIIMGRFFIRK